MRPSTIAAFRSAKEGSCQERPGVALAAKISLQSWLMAAIPLTVIGTAQAQSGAPAKISTVYTGDVSNGKKVVSSLSTSELEPGK